MSRDTRRATSYYLKRIEQRRNNQRAGYIVAGITGLILILIWIGLIFWY